LQKALTTGVTGQDVSYRAEFLIKKSHEVYGTKRGFSSFNTARVNHIYEDSNIDNVQFKLYYGDLTGYVRPH